MRFAPPPETPVPWYGWTEIVLAGARRSRV
jgi:hypothetical protein